MGAPLDLVLLTKSVGRRAFQYSQVVISGVRASTRLTRNLMPPFPVC
jgi:hypothetical protein